MNVLPARKSRCHCPHSPVDGLGVGVGECGGKDQEAALLGADLSLWVEELCHSTIVYII